MKVREVPAPKSDRLETLIGFGIAMQNLCDYMEIGQQVAHLNNPTFLYELVDKLPANIKLDWAMFKQQAPITNLRTFAQQRPTMPFIWIQERSSVQNLRNPKVKNFLGTHSGLRNAEDTSKSDVPQRRPQALSKRTLFCRTCWGAWKTTLQVQKNV